MKKLLILFIAVFFTLGCSSDSDSSDKNTAPPVSNNGLKLKREIKSSRTLTFEYNSKGYISKSIQNETSGELYENNYIYSGDKLIRIDHNHFNNNIVVKTTPEFFEYDGDLIVKSIIEEDNIYQETYYTYDQSGYLKTRDVHLNGESIGIENFEYSNGNLVKAIYTKTKIFTFTYDNKSNPSYNMFPIAYLKAFEASKNNLISDGYDTYTYEYNDKGYPIKQTIEGDLKTEVVEFEYY